MHLLRRCAHRFQMRAAIAPIGRPALTSQRRIVQIATRQSFHRSELLRRVSRISAKDRRRDARLGMRTLKEYRGQTECFASGLAAQARQFRGRLWKVPVLFDPGATFYATWRETQVFSAGWAARTSERRLQMTRILARVALFVFAVTMSISAFAGVQVRNHNPRCTMRNSTAQPFPPVSTP